MPNLKTREEGKKEFVLNTSMCQPLKWALYMHPFI